MAKYTSGRQRNLKVGISSYSENLTSIEVIGNVGIGTSNATSELYVVGNGYFTGIVTASNFDGNVSYATYADNAGIASVAGVATYSQYSGIATYASVAGISTYATNSGIASFASVAGVVTYSQYSGIATYADYSGIATYASVAGIVSYSDYSGIATYADYSGIATYASVAGIVSYSDYSGIATYADYSGIATYATDAGIATYAVSSDYSNTSGFSTSSNIASYASVSGVATALQNTRTFEIQGDVVSLPIDFNGTQNVVLTVEIQPNSVGLGSDTTGDYVETISGTPNQINVSDGTGEGSNPVISIADNPTLPGSVTIANDLQVNNNLNVTGNITVGGTAGYILVENFRVSDADIVLGFTTDSNGNDVSTDTTANHGGIAVASSEGNPLVTLNITGIETLPATYKKIMWFKAGAFAGLNTDAWLINYAVGIGSTQFPSGTRLAAGSVQFTEQDLAVVRNINASGIVTAGGGFVGSLTGTATTALNLSDAANITTGTISNQRLSGTYNIDVIGTATTAIDVIGGIGSISSLTVSGVTTTGLLNVGVGGTIITTVGVGSTTFVGIGSTQPGSTLVVNAPSGYSGNILDLQVGGSYLLRASKTTSGGNPVVLDIGGTSQAGIIKVFDTQIFAFYGSAYGTQAVRVTAPGGLNFGGSGDIDPVLLRDGNGVLAQRNAGIGQTFRIYNTYTSASQYERAYLGWNNNTFQIGVDTAGISTARSISLVGAAGSNTGDTLQPLQINQTWTAGTGIATALTLNVTDTSSNNSSKLLDLQVGGSSRFAVEKYGAVRANINALGSGLVNDHYFGCPTGSNNGFRIVGTGQGLRFSYYGFAFYNTTIGFTAGGIESLPDVVLARDSSNVLAQRNVGAGQTFRIYNTYTSASQYERAYLGWNNNTFQIGVDTAGISTARQMEFQTNGTTRLSIGATTGNLVLNTAGTAGTSVLVNAPSGFTGNLLDLQVNGSSLTRVASSGRIEFGFSGGSSSPQICGPSSSPFNLYLGGTNAAAQAAISSSGDGGIILGSTRYISWASGTLGASVTDIVIYRDTAGTLAQRNGANAQTFRVYNTYTSATNFERGSLGWSNNVFRIGTEKGSAGGTARQLELQTDGTTRVAITTDGFIDGTAFQSYELDDISTATDGQENTFVPRFNYDRVTITNPFRLTITVNGIPQSAFINNTDYVYQSNFLGSNNGYTIDTDNNIKFTESIPTGSEIVARVLPVSNTATRIKFYPFKPADILLGY
jgi:hypothetical protein